MADRYLIETSATDGYLLEDGTGVLILEVVAQTLTPSLFDDGTDTFFGPTLTVGAVSLSPGLFTDGDNFFAPSLVQNLSFGLFTNNQTFFDPTVVGDAPPATNDPSGGARALSMFYGLRWQM